MINQNCIVLGLQFFSYYYEKPDYDRARFLSDIGGAAGLILGMSIASILGFIDCILIYFLQFISKTFRYCKKSLYRNVAKVSNHKYFSSVLEWNIYRNWICLQWSSQESSPTKNPSDLKIFVFKLQNQKVVSTLASRNSWLKMIRYYFLRRARRKKLRFNWTTSRYVHSATNI